ncbi:MAG: hypothetical protein Q4C87_00655 [Actinomycetaceae bacterium]|nr:hypothetical protein [Actinomycetaceae bacterium]
MTLRQPYLRKLGALSAIAVFALSMSACSFHVSHTRTGSGASESSTTQSEATSSQVPAADSDQSVASASQSGPQGKVLASREGYQNAPYRIDIESVEGSSSKTTVRFRVTNLSDSERVELYHVFSGDDIHNESLYMQLLVGPDLVYDALRTSDGQCSCTTDFFSLDPGETMEFFSDFPALPENHDHISVAFPFDGVFHGLPVTRS